jgi:UPF0755 protein
MAKRRNRLATPFLIGLALAVTGAWLWISRGTAPTEPGAKRYIRYERPTRLGDVLADLEKGGVVRNAEALRFYSILTRHPQTVPVGTFSVAPGMDAKSILHSLASPVRQFVRLPETNWAKRTANVLQLHDVTQADEYMSLVSNPKQFQDDVPFPLKGPTLEGYLYPDTYDLPPLLGAKPVILRQLRAFDRKVWKKIQPKDLQRTLIVASMIQMEAGRKQDMPMIAGVIENRLKKNMPLQIDSTLLYGIQKWRRLTYADYSKIDSPYNTYTHKGLPPGPICSPTIDCIEAAISPAHHDYLYYVALPNGESVFSKTYEEHLKKVKERRKELAVLSTVRGLGKVPLR